MLRAPFFTPWRSTCSDIGVFATLLAVQVYGEDIAILAGDALLSFAFEHVARATPRTCARA
jgi:hypothetical protein